MTIHKFKRYTIWTDEVLWGKTAVKSGLTYGVYDNKENKQTYPKNINITSRQQALDEAEKLNNTLENPFEY